MKTDQITAVHYARGAYVYIRQSSTHQVLHHTESQQRQRDLVQRAVALGWSPEQVVVIDEDLGQSAARTGRRSGFEQLLADVAIVKPGSSSRSRPRAFREPIAIGTIYSISVRSPKRFGAMPTACMTRALTTTGCCWASKGP